jgi:uncharacterized protein (TIGR02217 family)
MSFHDVVYPLSVERCVSTWEWLTNIIELGGGEEQRIPQGADGRRKFDAAHGVRSLTDLQALLKFHALRHGETYGFKVRDLVDYTVSRGTEGTLQYVYNGVTASFQLHKVYTDAGASHFREIYKPESGSVKVYKNGSLLTAVTHYNINYATGIITFTAGNIPTVGQVIEWEGRFYVPVRFAVKEIPAAEFIATMQEATDGSNQWLVKSGTADLPEVPMIEIKDIS